MTTPLEAVMPYGLTLHPHDTGNYMRIGGGSIDAIVPTGVITVQVTWEGTESLYLWARRDGNPIEVVASDLTGRGRITAQVGSLTSCTLRVSADNHVAGSTTRRGALQIIPMPNPA